MQYTKESLIVDRVRRSATLHSGGSERCKNNTKLRLLSSPAWCAKVTHAVTVASNSPIRFYSGNLYSLTVVYSSRSRTSLKPAAGPANLQSLLSSQRDGYVHLATLPEPTHHTSDHHLVTLKRSSLLARLARCVRQNESSRFAMTFVRLSVRLPVCLGRACIL